MTRPEVIRPEVMRPEVIRPEVIRPEAWIEEILPGARWLGGKQCDECGEPRHNVGIWNNKGFVCQVAALPFTCLKQPVSNLKRSRASTLE